MKIEQPRPHEWVQRIDLHWIAENYDVFWRVAQRDGGAGARGAIAVDLTGPPVEGGHPVAYWSEAHVQAYGDAALTRMVAGYTPRTELVILLLKPGNRISAYRVRLMEE